MPAAELADLASAFFRRVELEPNPGAARRLGSELAGPDGALLVTGSLYLLGELSGDD